MHKPVALLLALCLAAPASAADDKVEARARAVAPFLDEQTVGVIRIDLARLNVDKLAAWLAEVGKLEAKDLDEAKRRLGGLLAGLVKAGATEMYLVVSLADLPAEPPFAVVPLPAGATGDAVLARLQESKLFDGAARIGNAGVAGGDRSLKRLRDLKPAARPEAARAFAAAGEAGGQLLFLPTADLRRAVEETTPALPKELGGGPSKVATRGLTWAAAGVDVAPKPSLRLVVQSPDAASAKALAESAAAVLKALGGQKEVRDLFPNFDALVPLLTPKVDDNRLSLTLQDKDLAAVLQPLLVRQRGAASRAQSANSLKQIGLAMHNYHDTRGTLPPQFSRDQKGQPLLSWRVHVLPFLGENEEKLYKEFRLDEPWDSEHNKKLIARMPAVFAGPNAKLTADGKTPYLVPVGPETVFTGGPKGVRIVEITDGTSSTVLAVEADDAHAVVWTRPDDLKIDPKQPRAGLAERKPGGFALLLADGSVHFIEATIDPKLLYALFTRAGGEVVNLP